MLIVADVKVCITSKSHSVFSRILQKHVHVTINMQERMKRDFEVIRTYTLAFINVLDTLSLLYTLDSNLIEI